jgi:thymidylate kinase
MPFHLKVYEGYLTIADLFKDRVVVVNGEQSKQEVLDTVKNVLYPFIKERMG